MNIRGFWRSALGAALVLCLGAFPIAAADAPDGGVTLRTVTNFSSADPAAPQYNAILKEYQDETGNTVEDASITSDEGWKTSILNDFAAGNEADILFFFAATADSQPILSRVVPIEEINAAYPELHLREDETLREADGKVYAIPVRSFWEGLFCNADLFDLYGLELPTDWDKLVKAIEVFRQNGIVPLATSLSDIPHYIVEFLILASGPPQDHQARPEDAAGIPQSWIDGMALLHELYRLGAFAENVNATQNLVEEQMFRDKRAAMRVDGSWFANSIVQANWDTTVVMPFPAHSDSADPTAIIGGTSMGFYLTRSAWEDETKRDAAVRLLAKLTSDESATRMGFVFGGELFKSARRMLGEADVLCTPIADTMDVDARSYWFAKAPALADGSLDPETVMREVIERGAY